jgi:hypothetical protein
MLFACMLQFCDGLRKRHHLDAISNRIAVFDRRDTIALFDGQGVAGKREAGLNLWRAGALDFEGDFRPASALEHKIDLCAIMGAIVERGRGGGGGARPPQSGSR